MGGSTDPIADPGGGTMSTEYSSGRSAGSGRMSSLYPSRSPTAVKAVGEPVRDRPGHAPSRRHAQELQHDGMTELPLDQVDARLAEDPTADVLCPLGEVHVRVRPVRADRHTRARIAEEDRGRAGGSRVPQREPYRHARRTVGLQLSPVIDGLLREVAGPVGRRTVPGHEEWIRTELHPAGSTELPKQLLLRRVGRVDLQVTLARCPSERARRRGGCEPPVQRRPQQRLTERILEAVRCRRRGGEERVVVDHRRHVLRVDGLRPGRRLDGADLRQEIGGPHGVHGDHAVERLAPARVPHLEQEPSRGREVRRVRGGDGMRQGPEPLVAIQHIRRRRDGRNHAQIRRRPERPQREPTVLGPQDAVRSRVTAGASRIGEVQGDEQVSSGSFAAQERRQEMAQRCGGPDRAHVAAERLTGAANRIADRGGEPLRPDRRQRRLRLPEETRSGIEIRSGRFERGQWEGPSLAEREGRRSMPSSRLGGPDQ